MRALALTAQQVLAARHDAKQWEGQLRELVMAVAPALLAEPGIGPISAAQLLISWSHPGRFRSEAAFAMLAGAAPVQALLLAWPGRPSSPQPWWGPAAESGLAHHRDALPDPSWADQGLHQPPHRPGQEPARGPPLPQAHRRPPAVPTAGAHRHQLEDSKHQDPAGQPVEVVRRIRDDIDGRVRRLLAEFVPTGA